MGQLLVESFSNDDALAAAAAAGLLDQVAAAAAAGRELRVALSGGRVMRKFHAAAAALAAQRGVALAQVQFFWADERCVPPDDAQSNFGQARADLLEPARVPAENVHRVPGEFSPASAAQAASDEMRRVCAVAGPTLPVLDLVLLGMGEDGHVASLFPGDGATAADVTSVFLPVCGAPTPPPTRVTLGHGPLAAARALWVLAAGPGKQAALRQSLAAAGSTPLARVIALRQCTTIFTDIL